MKQSIYIFIFLILNNFMLCGQAPSWSWAKNYGSYGHDIGQDVATDGFGHIYTVGAISGTTSFDSITLTYLSGDDVFLVKHDLSGHVLWAKGIAGNTGGAGGMSVAVDNAGYVYITGWFRGPNITIGSVTLGNAGNFDSFLAKYDSSGNVIWAKRCAGNGDDWTYNTVADKFGNVFIVGSYSGNSISFGSGITLINTGSTDIFIAKYDSSGNALWANSIGGIDNDYGIDIACDEFGELYVTGAFDSHFITFGNISLTNTWYATYDGDVFIAKYDSTGNIIWAKNAIGHGGDVGYGITVDNYANVYVSGIFLSDTLTFDNTILTKNAWKSLFILKLDSAGNVIWGRNIDGADFNNSEDIITDNLGNLYITVAYFGDSITVGNTTLINEGNLDILVPAYNSSGNPVWAKGVGGNGFDESYAITGDGIGNLYVAGQFDSYSIICGIDTLMDHGLYYDIFLAKLSTTVNQISENENENDFFTIYPNPADKKITLIIPVTTKKVQILNSLGQLVQSKIVDNQTKLSISLATQGIYFINVVTNEGSFTKKLIVSN